MQEESNKNEVISYILIIIVMLRYEQKLIFAPYSI